MTTTYTLSIDSLATAQDGTVEAVCWMLLADDGAGLQAARKGEIELPPAGDKLTPFEELTEAQVMTWVDDALSGQLDAIKADLAAELQELAQPPRHRRPPWQPERKQPKLRPVVGQRDRRNQPTPKAPRKPQ